MFKKILVPIDGSEHSIKALNTAASIAEKYDSEVTLICVIELPTASSSISIEAILPQNIVDNLENEAKEILKSAADKFKSNNIKYFTVIGHPAAEIIAESAKGYDLVVIGSRGLGELKGFILGSVSSRVMHHVKCSVMVIH